MPILYETIQRHFQKKATEMRIYLWDETGKTTRMENKTVDLGTKIVIRTGLFQPVNGFAGIDDRLHAIFHRLNTGAFEKIAEKVALGTNSIETVYTLNKKGVHIFVATFPGDAEYTEATSKEAKIGVNVAVEGIPKGYLIGGGLAVVGLMFVGLALKRR